LQQRPQVFQASIDSISSLIVCVREIVNNVLLGLRLARFLKRVTQ
jgi:hypothetical protein